MQTVNRVPELRAAVDSLRAGGEVALVPTMGALHEGHLALVHEARRHAASVVVSIFVNPTQFGPNEDLAAYPRQLAEDSRLLEAEGVDLLLAPPVDEVYPEGFATVVSVAQLGETLCGASRPGHFDGVATVVAKLFIACLPDVAIFGEKDWQQLAVIRRMTVDLGLPIQIVGHPTVREEDGLAMSSRNALLSEDERERATLLSEALETARDCILAGGSVEASLDIGMALLEAGDFKIDYLAYVAGDTLEPLDGFRPDGRLIAAASLGKVRLIDNVRVLSATG